MVVDTSWRRLSLLVLLFWLASLLALGGGAAMGTGAPRQTFPFAPMPPRPGLLEELQQAGRPLPYLLRETATLHERGLNQGPQQVDAAGRLVPSPIASPQGSFRALALLVQFTDKPAQVGASYFDTLVFGSGTGAVRDYYRQVSYGTLDIVTVNLPSSMGWFGAPQTYAYYCNEQNGLGAYPQNAQKLVEDVVALADPLLTSPRSIMTAMVTWMPCSSSTPVREPSTRAATTTSGRTSGSPPTGCRWTASTSSPTP